MALTNESGFIGKHVEKIIVAAVAVFLLVVVLRVATPPKVELSPALGKPGKAYGLGEVDKRLLEQSQGLDDIVDSHVPDSESPAPYGGWLADRFDNAAARVGPYGIWTPPTPPLVPKGKGPETEKKVKTADLMRLAADSPPLIAKPAINAVREVKVMLRPQEDVTAGKSPYKYEEVIAIHGAAAFRRGQLQKKWMEALTETGVRDRLTVAVVEVRRRERVNSGPWSKPTLISRVTADPNPLPPLPAYDGKNLDEVRLAISDLAHPGVQESIVEPPYWNIVGRDGAATGWQINKPRTEVSDLLEKPSPPASGTPATGVGRPGGVSRPRPPAGTPGRWEPTGRMPTRRSGTSSAGALTGARREADARRASDAWLAARARSHAARGGTAAARGSTSTDIRRAADARRAMEARRAAQVGRAAPIRRSYVLSSGPVGPGANPVPVFQQQLDHPKGIVEVWFHDTDAALRECVSYSYQVRLVLISPLFGLVDVVADKPDAAKLTLTTAWSAWSEPVTVKRPTEFFVAAAGGSGMVPVDVFTMKWGQRVKHSFTVRQGEPIGGKSTVRLRKLGEQELVDVAVDFATGAIAVDLAFGRKRPAPNSVMAGSTTELLYLDVDGRLQTRTALADRVSLRYKKLLSEVSWREEGGPERLIRPGLVPPRGTGPERRPPPDRRLPERRVPPRGTAGRPAGGVPHVRYDR